MEARIPVEKNSFGPFSGLWRLIELKIGGFDKSIACSAQAKVWTKGKKKKKKHSMGARTQSEKTLLALSRDCEGRLS